MKPDSDLNMNISDNEGVRLSVSGEGLQPPRICVFLLNVYCYGEVQVVNVKQELVLDNVYVD